MVLLTDEQAYAAMILFIERYCRNTNNTGEAVTLVSGMHLVAPRDSFDPGYWHEWMGDVQTVLDAAKTPESWQEFTEEQLDYTLTREDDTVIRARPGK